MKRYIKYVVIVLALALLGIVVVNRIVESSTTKETHKQQIVTVKVQTPSRQDVTYSVKLDGDIEPYQQANIYSKVSGNVERLYADMGSVVRDHQLLAVIDSAALYQTMLQARATANNTRLSYERVRVLLAKNLSSKQELDNAKAAMDQAEASYEGAAIQLSYVKILAPFSGVITKRFVDQGQVIAANTSVNNSTIYTLMDLDQLRVFVNVPEKDVQSIAKVEKAFVTVDALPGQVFDGVVAHTSEAVNPATRTMTVEVLVPNRNHLLKPGQFGRVTMVLGEHPQAITVPSESILKDTKGSYVFVVQNGTAHRKDVQIGMEESGNSEILSGLDGTESVVSSGQTFAKDGNPVKIEQ